MVTIRSDEMGKEMIRREDVRNTGSRGRKEWRKGSEEKKS